MMTAERKIQARHRAEEYLSKRKNKKLPSGVKGFIVRNGIVDKTDAEIDALVQTAQKLHGGEIRGEGDKFKEWCEAHGRVVPDDDLLILMNGDPYEAGKEVKKRIPDSPELWRAYCTYLSGSGRRRV